MDKNAMDQEDYKAIDRHLRKLDRDLAACMEQHLKETKKAKKKKKEEDKVVDVDAIVKVLSARASNPASKEGTREASVRWLCRMNKMHPERVSPHVDELLPMLASLLAPPAAAPAPASAAAAPAQASTAPSTSSSSGGGGDSTLLLSMQFVADVCNFDRRPPRSPAERARGAERFRGFVGKVFELYGSSREVMTSKGRNIIR